MGELIAPLIVVLVVLGSIYGGVTGITEAAGMGTVAVLITSFPWRTVIFPGPRRADAHLPLHGHDHMGHFRRHRAGGAYTIAGGPTYVANLIVGAELPTLGHPARDDGYLSLSRRTYGLGRHRSAHYAGIPADRDETSRRGNRSGRACLSIRAVPVWFGILFCVNMQVSFLSPPFAPAAFYLKSVAPPEIRLPDIYRSFMPFMGIQLLVLAIVLLWPGITMFFHG